MFEKIIRTMFFNLMRRFLAVFRFLVLSPTLVLKMMILEEKIGQLLMVHFNGEIVNNEAKTHIQKIHVGGKFSHPDSFSKVFICIIMSYFLNKTCNRI